MSIRSVAALLLMLIISSTAMAQRFEVHAYAGGILPARWANTSSLKSESLYGAKGGVFLTQQIEVEGNFAYLNHFRFEERDMGARSFLWDVNGSFGFPGLNIKRFEPFVTAGAGQTKVNIRGRRDQRVILLDPTFRNPDSLMGPLVLTDGESFLTLNYGGGLKAFRLWGPFGLRTDFRGRTMPNFFGHANNWFEVTAGVNVAWGER